MKCLAIEYHL